LLQIGLILKLILFLLFLTIKLSFILISYHLNFISLILTSLSIAENTLSKAGAPTKLQNFLGDFFKNFLFLILWVFLVLGGITQVRFNFQFTIYFYCSVDICRLDRLRKNVKFKKVISFGKFQKFQRICILSLIFHKCLHSLNFNRLPT